MTAEVQRGIHVEFTLGACLVGLLTCWMVLGSVGVVPYSWLHLVCHAAGGVGVAAWLVIRQPGASIPLHWILLSALMLRAICLFGEPLFEDDHYRYLWEGLLVAAGEDPFGLPPAAWFVITLPPEHEVVLSRVSFPDVSTVYGPALQWLFGAAAWLAPGQIWPLQLLAAIADMCILGALAWLAGSRGRRWLLLYAWSPLLLKEFALTAHPDVIAVAILMGALLCRRGGWLVFAGALVGVAAGVKIFAIIALPFLALGDSSRPSLLKNVTLLGIGFSIALASIALAWGTPSVWYPEGLRSMASSWLFNSPLPILFIPITGFSIAKLLLLGLFTGAAFWIWYGTLRAGGDFRLSSLAFIYGLFLVATPVINPWYLVWVLAFSVSRPMRWPWVASVVLLVSYATGHGTGIVPGAEYQLPVWLILTEFSTIALAAMLDWRRPLNSESKTVGSACSGNR